MRTRRTRNLRYSNGKRKVNKQKILMLFLGVVLLSLVFRLCSLDDTENNAQQALKEQIAAETTDNMELQKEIMETETIQANFKRQQVN